MYNLRKMFVMLSLGFGSGLPYILLISTTSAWLRDAGVELSLIGFFAWITFAYTIKFIWAPLVFRKRSMAIKTAAPKVKEIHKLDHSNLILRQPNETIIPVPKNSAPKRLSMVLGLESV